MRSPSVLLAIPLGCTLLMASCSEHAGDGAPMPSAIVATTAPSGSASGNAPMDPNAAAVRYVKTMQGVAEIFAQNEKACGGLAEKLREYRERHAAVLDAPAPEIFGIIEADESLHDQMKSAMTSVMDGSMACRDNPGFQKLHAELEARARKANL